MANEWQLLSKDYRKVQEQLITPIYHQSVASDVYPIINDLKPHTLESRYFTQKDDPQYRYNMESEYALTYIGYTPTDVPTPSITANLHYGYDELMRIQDSTIPFDGRVGALHKIYEDAWDRIAFTGSTVALDDVAVTSVATAGTNSVAWGATPFNTTTSALCVKSVEYGIGQIIDGLGKIGDPLALVVPPDEYKNIRGLRNTITNQPLIDELNDLMRGINAKSPGVVMSKYLDCTVVRDHPGSYTITAGSDVAALYNINPQYYRIHTSTPDIRETTADISVHGKHYQIVQRYRPIYIKKEAIIFEAAVT